MMTIDAPAAAPAAPAVPPAPTPQTHGPSGIPTLDAAALASLERTLRVMLSPLDYPDWQAWRAAIHDELIDLARAKYISIHMPFGGAGNHPDDYYAPLVHPRAVRMYAEDLRHLTKPLEGRLAAAGIPAMDEYEFITTEERRGVLYNEFVMPHDLLGMTLAEVDIGAGKLARMFVIGGKRDLWRHDPDRAALLRTLAPAFRAGTATWRRLGAQRSELARVVDAVRDAVFIYDAAGALQHANPTAARLAASADGARVSQEAQQLAWAVAALHRRRRDRDALGAAADATREVRTAAGVYRVKGALAGESTIGSQPMVLVTVELAAPEPLTDEQLRARFALTEREVGVARLVAAGLSNQELADRLGVSFYTARNHVERLLAKLGAGNRARVGAMLRGE